MYRPRTRIMNKQQSVSQTESPKRTTVKDRTCLGILADEAYCNNVFLSLDAADRLCPSCKIVRNGRFLIKTSKLLNSRRMKHEPG